MVSMRGIVLGLLAASAGSALHVPNSLLLDSVAEALALPMFTWSANGTHNAKAFTTKQANVTSTRGLKEDCENINLNRKLATDFRSDVLGDGVSGFFYKCEQISATTNKYWFTISAGDQSQIDKLCSSDTSYPIVYDGQHKTWFVDEPFDCTQRTAPSRRS